MTALLVLDPKYLNELGVPEDAIKGAVLMSTPYRIPRAPRGQAARSFTDAFGNDPEVYQDAWPIHHVQNARTPLLVMIETVADDQHNAIGQLKPFKQALEATGFKHATFIEAKDRDHRSIVQEMIKQGDDPQRAAIVEFIQKRRKDLNP